MSHGNCQRHAYRRAVEIARSIGRVTIEVCNNCLSVVVVQRRDTDKADLHTEVELKNSAYPYVDVKS